MRLYAHAIAFVSILCLAACGEEDTRPDVTSSDPTAAQLSQALSDPAFIAATDVLASEGLGVDTAAAQLITTDSGDWAIELPISAFYSGDLVAYESLVYDVVSGSPDVYFVLADEPRVETEGLAAANVTDGLGRATYNADVCGPWGPWHNDGWGCRPSIECPTWKTLFEHIRRGRNCERPNGTVYRQVQHFDAVRRCGC